MSRVKPPSGRPSDRLGFRVRRRHIQVAVGHEATVQPTELIFSGWISLQPTPSRRLAYQWHRPFEDDRECPGDQSSRFAAWSTQRLKQTRASHSLRCTLGIRDFTPVRTFLRARKSSASLGKWAHRPPSRLSLRSASSGGAISRASRTRLVWPTHLARASSISTSAGCDSRRWFAPMARRTLPCAFGRPASTGMTRSVTSSLRLTAPGKSGSGSKKLRAQRRTSSTPSSTISSTRSRKGIGAGLSCGTISVRTPAPWSTTR